MSKAVQESQCLPRPTLADSGIMLRYTSGYVKRGPDILHDKGAKISVTHRRG